MPSNPAHGKFDGVSSKDIITLHPSPDKAAGDIALSYFQAAMLATRLNTEARFQKNQVAQAHTLLRVAWLRRRSHLLQNGDEAKEIDLGKVAFERTTAIVNGEQSRINTANQINFAQESGAWKTKPFAPTRKIDSFLAEAVATPRFQDCAVRLVDALLTYEFAFIINFSLLFPATRKAEIKMAIHVPHIPTDARIALVREASELSGEHAAVVSNMAKQELHDQYQDYIKPIEVELLQIALAAVTQKQAEDVEAEKAHCALHDLIWKPGQLATRRDVTVKALNHSLASFNPANRPVGVWNSQAIHRSGGTVLTTVFGIAFDTLDLACAAEPTPTPDAA